MALRRTSARNSTINRGAPAETSTLEHYCRGLDDWPRAWMGLEKDVAPGERLVACFRPFLQEIIGSDLSRKTIQRHVDNLWALGGEIIRRLHEDPSLRRKRIEQVLAEYIDEEGGPLVYAMESEEQQQRSLDSTCKKLYRFLNRSGEGQD